MTPAKAREFILSVPSIPVELATERLLEFVNGKGKKEFTPPTIEEVRNFFNENGYKNEYADKVYKYYQEAEPQWTDSRGKKIRGWKQKMRGNWFREEGKIVSSQVGKPSVLQVNKQVFK
jgi:hypothetical protein